MYKKIIPVILTIAVLITACGPQGTPTMSPIDVEGTAVAAAWTIVAATQQAIPTATPLPPTETPSPTPPPTFTPEPLPTLEELPSPTATNSSLLGSGTCEGIMNLAEAGPTSQVRFENETGASVTFSLYLGTPNAFGQCGFIPGLTPLSKNEKRPMQLPKGNFYLYFIGDQAGTGSCYVNNRVGDNHGFAVKIKKNICVVP